MTRRLVEPRPNTMRRDPGETNKSFFGFVDLPSRGESPLIDPEIEFYPGRLGAAERDLMVEKGEAAIHISLSGWYTDKVSLPRHQAEQLYAALGRMLAS